MEAKVSIIQKAKQFALKAHGEQKYGNLPYMVHLDAVNNIAQLHSLNESIQAAAYLHDVIEDTYVTYEEIKSEFSKKIADLVWAVTSETGRNREERNRKTYKKISKSTDAILLKLCDRIANIENAIATNKDDLLHIYKKEHNEFYKAMLGGESGSIETIPLLVHYKKLIIL